MTEAERQALVAAAMAMADEPGHEPGVVAAAFLPGRAEACGLELGALTFRGWLELARARSPWISGEWETLDDERAVLAVAEGVKVLAGADTPAAAIAGRLAAGGLPALLEAADAVARRMREAWGTAVAMRHPDDKGGARGGDDGDGFGRWLPVFAAVVTQLGTGWRAALDTPVNVALALLAGARRNEGWRVTGERYADRDLPEQARDGDREDRGDDEREHGGDGPAKREDEPRGKPEAGEREEGGDERRPHDGPDDFHA